MNNFKITKYLLVLLVILYNKNVKINVLEGLKKCHYKNKFIFRKLQWQVFAALLTVLSYQYSDRLFTVGAKKVHSNLLYIIPYSYVWKICLHLDLNFHWPTWVLRTLLGHSYYLRDL